MTDSYYVPLKNKASVRITGTSKFSYELVKLNPSCSLLDPHQPNLFHECCFCGSILQYIVAKTLNLFTWLWFLDTV